MPITQVMFAFPDSELDPEWALRLDVEGSGFVARAVPPTAYVGDVPVERIVTKVGFRGFVGMLRTLPPEGAELKVGYLNSPLISTGFTYQTPPPVAT